MRVMRSLLAEEVAPLVGSLGLHAALVLAFVCATHPTTRAPEPARPQRDAWLGNAVEVDAVASPEGAPSPQRTATEASDGAPTENGGAVTPPRAASAPVATPQVASEASLGRRATAPAPKRPPPRAAKSPAVEPSSGGKSATRAEGAAGSTAAPAAGAFGGEGLPPGVRSLPSAFTRAIPPATGADPVWQTLPVGSEHPFTIAVEVDAEGHIFRAEIVKEQDGSEPTSQATHLKQRVVALLGGGLFALQNNIGEGRALFRITITLSDRAVHEEDDPAQLVERGFDPPHGSSPGRAYFTLASGRHFEAKVQVLSQK